jgi:hypothetical protein
VAPDSRIPAHALVGFPQREHEATDHALAALEVPVEDVDAHPLRRLDGSARFCELRAARISEGALPEADVSRGDVEVAGERREGLERRVNDFRAELELGIEVPAVQDGDPGADVANGDDEIDGLVRRCRNALASRDREPDVVWKPALTSGSCMRDGTSSGRCPARRDCSATRAARFAERTDASVTPARASVPPAVASAEIVAQSATARVYGHEVATDT